MTGEWRPVAGHPGYSVSDQGEVRGPRGRVLSPWTASPRGYPHLVYFKVALWARPKRRVVYVHRLVCETFHGPAPADFTDCCHLNHDTSDNRAENLAWSTHGENMREIHTPDAAERRAIRDEACERLVLAADDGSHGAPF